MTSNLIPNSLILVRVFEEIMSVLAPVPRISSSIRGISGWGLVLQQVRLQQTASRGKSKHKRRIGS